MAYSESYLSVSLNNNVGVLIMCTFIFEMEMSQPRAILLMDHISLVLGWPSNAYR